MIFLNTSLALINRLSYKILSKIFPRSHSKTAKFKDYFIGGVAETAGCLPNYNLLATVIHTVAQLNCS